MSNEERPEMYPLRASAEAIRLQPAGVEFAYAAHVDGRDVFALHVHDERVGDVVLPLGESAAMGIARGLLTLVAGQDELRAAWLERNAGAVTGEGN